MTVEVVADVSGAVPLAALPSLPRKQTDRKSSRKRERSGGGRRVEGSGSETFFFLTGYLKY